MMIGFLAPLLGLPRWAKMALGVAALGLAVLLLHKCAVREAVKADRSAAKAAAVSKAREADEGATRAAESTREGIETKNEAARRAAEESDDPLKAGLDELRKDR